MFLTAILLLAGNAAASPAPVPQATAVGVARARILSPAEVRRVGDWLLVRSGLGAAALYAAAGLDLVTTGPTAGCEVRSPGRHNGWIVAVGQDFEALAARLATATVTFDAAARRLALDLPDRPVLALDYQAGLSLGGEAMPFRHFSPVPTLAFHSARPQISPLHPFLASGK